MTTFHFEEDEEYYYIKCYIREAERIGKKIIDLREKAGLSQYALAKLSDVPQPYIARYEAGKVLPRIDTLRRLAKALGTSIKDFLDED